MFWKAGCNRFPGAWEKRENLKTAQQQADEALWNWTISKDQYDALKRGCGMPVISKRALMRMSNIAV